MRIFKNITAVLLILSLVIFPVNAEEKSGNTFTVDSSFGIKSGYGRECDKAVDYLTRALKSIYNTELNGNAYSGEKAFIFSVEGDKCDYAVSPDFGNKSVTFSGGSEEALLRAVYSFLAVACGQSDSVLTVSEDTETAFDFSRDSVDNSALLSYKNDSVVPSYSDGVIYSPEWLKSLIMVEIRPDTASIGGTLEESKRLVDFYASVGVNGIWLAPVYDRGTLGNGYSNFGPHTVDPVFSGTTDYNKGWQAVRSFVEYAHSKGIYVFLDVITWGVVKNAPLLDEHPEWFSGEAWGNAAFDWSNNDLREWFTQTLVNNIITTGADGYRCDCEPNYTGYDIYADVRRRLNEKGVNIAIMSEDPSKRSSTYDLEQEGVFDYSSTDRGALYQNPVNFFTDGYLNIVDCVKSGKGLGTPEFSDKALKRGSGRFYTHCITNHDYQHRCICGSRLKIGYSAILSPFIPIWYMGDEFNCTNTSAVQYDIPVDFSEREIAKNAFFLEDVKKMINIRRTFTDIFEADVICLRDTKMCKVKTEGLGSLQSYARFSGNKAIITVPNNGKNFSGTVSVPFSACGLNGFSEYTVTDLMNGKVIKKGTAKEISSFTAAVPEEYVGVYLVEGTGEKSPFSLNISGFFDCIREFFYKFAVNCLTKLHIF